MKRILGLTIAALSLLIATPARAGTYEVKACFSTPGGLIGNGSWAAEVSSGYATAYTVCPGDGIVTRMSGSNRGDLAPYGVGARHVFTAPPGTRVAHFRANVNEIGIHGWYAGLVDSSPRWIWAGTEWTTWGYYQWVALGMDTPQLFAQVTCGAGGGCPRGNQYGLIAMRDIVVTVRDDIPPGVAITGGSVTAGGWRSGNQDVHYSAWDSTGIRAVDVFVDGQRRGTANGRCNDMSARPCQDEVGGFTLGPEHFVGDGRHTVTVRAYDGAWNASETSRLVLVDKTPPAQPFDVRIAGPDGWRAQNRFDLTWHNPPETAAPIAAARYSLCPSANPAGDTKGCTQGVRRARGIESLTELAVPGQGNWRLGLWLEDEAGNADPERSVTLTGLGFDDVPPELHFAPEAASDPTRVRVKASDATSGIGEAWIEAKRRGEDAWRSLPTALEKDGFAATIDDEKLPKGHYELRAHARDLAGNEQSTQNEGDGTSATRTLPLRLATRLAVGKPKRLGARGAKGKRRRTILIVRPRASYGRTIPLRGRLTTPGANPLASANVEVWERIKLPSAKWRRVGHVRTSKTGRFRFKALRGPSRVLRFRYPGTATIRARSKHVELRVRAKTSLRVTEKRVVNGEEIRFRGRLKGRQTAATGKLIHLQVYTRGRWSTFATPRANRLTGSWSVPYRFTATRGRVRYRFRAFVPREATFPYETGVSHSVYVTVHGL